MYTPLPKGLRIQPSKINGDGLFTLMFTKKDTNLGMSHVILGEEIIRTPLGGFINHSDDPNCIKVKRDNRYYLNTIKDVVGGDELTVKYSFYKIQTESERLQEELDPLRLCPMADDK